MDALCSARLLQPFMRLVSSEAAHRDLVPDDFWSVHGDARVSLVATHSMLDRGVERLRDQQLGLKLGSTMCFGAGGAFDYAIRTAATFGDSMRVASKYSSLLADSFHISFERFRNKAVVRMEDGVSWPVSAADFAMSGFYKLHVSEPTRAADIECWFPYSEPADTSTYRRIFSGAALKFGAPFFGFAFEDADAEAPMPGADPGLHSLLVARVAGVLSELRTKELWSAVVRRVIEDHVRNGRASAEGVANALHMSRRSMTRRLEAEGSTFQTELDAVRRRLAIDHVQTGKVPLVEIAFLSGFSHVESFHRAFKRWTGQTPLGYRSAHSSGQA